VEKEEVEKMLKCKEEQNVFVYYCEKCNETHTLAYGCNSRLCSALTRYFCASPRL